MGMPPKDFEKESDDFEKRLKEGKKTATIQLIFFIVLLIVFTIAVFYGISKIMPSTGDISGWLNGLFQAQNHP